MSKISFVYCTNKDVYESNYSAGSIKDEDICFIEDSGSIVTKQTEYKSIKWSILGPPLITFNIGSHELQAEEGMTWGEWIVSDYNTTGYILSEACSLLDLDRKATDNGSNGACPDTVIEAGRLYDAPSEPM